MKELGAYQKPEKLEKPEMARLKGGGKAGHSPPRKQ